MSRNKEAGSFSSNGEAADDANNHEQAEIDRSSELKLGANILTLANFQNNESVKKSFNLLRFRGEKLESTNPNMRRNEAYLKRLNRIIENRGSDAEKLLWKSSAESIETIETEDITDATWKSIQQEYWDHGGNVLEDTPELRKVHAEEYSGVQKGDLEKYVNYFTSEECTFPTWFKIYAWDGLTRLSRITKIGKEGFPVFQSRDNHTAATFPKINPAALAKVYDDITSHYGMPTDGEAANVPNDDTDKILERLIQSGSFAKLYSFERSKLFNSVPVPERTEDIDGEWREYDIDKVDEISDAAGGTPWCITSPTTAENYLKYGTYGTDGRSRYKDHSGAKSRFILYHLKDPKTDKYSGSACASIRLDPDGNVAEISGILGESDQLLHDSLLPIVKEKVKSLPGGEKKLQAFLDNEKLIALDKKFDRHEPFTDEELEFIMCTKRPIERINHGTDERIPKLFDIPALIANGVSVDKIVEKINPENFSVKKIVELRGAGANEDKLLQILPKMKHWPNGLDTKALLDNGVDPNKIVKLDGFSIKFLDGFNNFVEAGMDPSEVVKYTAPQTIIENINHLREAGAKIDVLELVDRMTPQQILKYRKLLPSISPFDSVDKPTMKGFFDRVKQTYMLQKKTRLPDLFKRIGTGELKDKEVIKELVDERFPANKIVDKLAVGAASNEAISMLLDKHADANKLTEKLTPDQIVDNLTALRKAGAQIDANVLMEKTDFNTIARNLIQLRDAGATIDIDTVLKESKIYVVANHLKDFIEMGADTNEILLKLSTINVDQLKEMTKSGVDINKTLDYLDTSFMNADDFLDLYTAGASIEKLTDITPPSVLNDCIDLLQSRGDANSLDLANTLRQTAWAR